MRAECRLHSFTGKRLAESRAGRGGVKREV
jgi:hypothetical protein